MLVRTGVGSTFRVGYRSYRGGHTLEEPMSSTDREGRAPAPLSADTEAASRLSVLQQRESLFGEQGLLRVRGVIAEG